MVPRFIIDEAVEKIKAGAIIDYVCAVKSGKLVRHRKNVSPRKIAGVVVAKQQSSAGKFLSRYFRPMLHGADQVAYLILEV